MDLPDFPAPSKNAEGIYPSDISVDVEGDWFYKGNKIIRDDILELFLNCIRLSSDNRFLIEWNRNLCSLEVADTPFVIARVDRIKSDKKEGNIEEEIVLSLRHLSTKETLDPSTLYVGKENVLYCRIRGGQFPARFSRPAYYQLAEWIQEDPESGDFYLGLNGIRNPIKMRE